MSIPPNKRELNQAKRAFWTPVVACAAGIAGIHMLAPKFNTPNSSIRMLMTAGYFLAWIVILVKCLTPRETYMKALFAWRFADAPEGVRKAWQSYLFSINSVVQIAVYLLLALACGAGIEVMSRWWQGLVPLAGSAYWLRVVGLLGLLTMPLYMGGRLAEVAQRRRMLHELTQTSDFEPRKPSDKSPEENSNGPAVVVRSEGIFSAGGFDWRLEDFYKNGVVFGQSGTGKTICVLNALLEGFLGSTSDTQAPAGALILDPKGDYLGKIRGLCERHGRADDLLILDPVHPEASIRWNPLDSADDELQLAMRFAAVMEALGQKNEKDSFFTDAARTFMRHAIRLIRLTNRGEPPSLDDIQEVATSWAGLARRAQHLAPARMSRDDDATLDYFASQWVDLAPETRTSIVATLSNMIDPFLMEPYRTIFSGRSDHRIADVVDRGKILYVHMPIADREGMSRMICTIIKLEYYREILRRPNKRRPSLFFCDEFQCFFTTAKGIGDADFFERSRQSNHANIIATQNLPALLKYTERPEPIDNLLGNCAVKIFLRNTDDKTNKWSAELFGKELQGVGGVSVSDNNLGRRKQAPGANIGYQEGFKVRPEAFSQLRVPSREGVAFAESIVHLSSREVVARHRLAWHLHEI